MCEDLEYVLHSHQVAECHRYMPAHKIAALNEYSIILFIFHCSWMASFDDIVLRAKSAVKETVLKS